MSESESNLPTSPDEPSQAIRALIRLLAREAAREFLVGAGTSADPDTPRKPAPAQPAPDTNP